MAEQIEPVERRVALKIIKPGMDTKAVIARFEAERQALAMMDHPNIAKVLDVGTTNSGRPYFVMELVRGVPITQYCDEHHLTPRQRLELFLPVCQAVQHAHQKGIIHRDIKPSNVLVAEYDDRPVPKIIDFGLAKAMEKRLTAKTMFTEFGQIVGTPDYMSPEQAKLNQMDIDTRSDIYSLGVLLYELLSGNTPFDRQRMRSAAFDELLRIIREEEPPKPSQRLSTVDTLPSIAANRHITPAELTRQLSGELDWIVMKTLEKDRSRRYDTANGLAADLQRFLDDEPVLACPPSTSYRIRKFARRNKAPLAMATAVTLALVTVAIGSTIAASRFRSLAARNAELAVAATHSEATAIKAQQEAEAARDGEQGLRIEAQRQTKIATEALVDARQQRERAEESFVLARSAVDEFLNHVTKNELLTVPGMQPLRQKLLSSAMEFYNNFTQDEDNSGELLVELAAAHYRIAVISSELGQKEASSSSNAKSIEIFEKLVEGGNDSLDVRLGLAKSFFRAKRYDDTVTLCREILKLNAEHPPTRSLLANAYNSLAIGDEESVEIGTALEYHQQALALREGLASEFPRNADYIAELGGTLNNLGVLLASQNKNREALAMFQRGVSYAAEAYELAPQSITWGRWLSIGLKNVAIKQALFSEQDNALQSYQQYVDVCRKLAFENPAVPSLKGELHQALMDLANYQRELNLTVAADRSFKAAQEVLENIDRTTPAEMFDLAIVYGALSLPTEGSVELSEKDQAERQRYADLAIETIAEAVKNGFSDVKAMKSHKSLAALRDRDDFQMLFKELRAKELAAQEVDTDDQKLANRRKSVNLLRELAGNGSAGSRHRKTLAATLHSVGEIQIGLKNYDEARASLQEALQTSQAILDEQPDDPQASLNVLGVEYSQGRLHMAQERYPEAHRDAQGCLEKLLQIAQNHFENQDLQREISIQERKLYQLYGRCGLFPLVRDYAARSVKFHRVRSTADLPELATEGEFSAIVLLDTDEELARGYLSQLVESVQNTEYWDVFHLVRVLAAAGGTDLLSDELLSRYQTFFDENPDKEWIAVGMAMVHYRYDRFPEAQSVLEKFRYSTRPQIAFLDAAIAAKLGDKERARQRWSDGETRYQQNCRAALDRGVADNDNGIFHESWWQFIYDAAMRRLAVETMSPGQAADDPWLHLIQARGYATIGEIDQAEAELSAALAASANNVDALLARMRLFEQLQDERFSADAEWQKVVDLAADDPMAWIHRGRWNMQRGEKKKAEADFAKAASLTPDELNKFLEAGWWIAGPYPSKLSDFYRPEIETDPSKPVPLIDLTTGVSSSPSPWLDVQHEIDGFIHPKKLFGGQTDGSVYALAYVYSPDERTEFIRIDRGSAPRVWWNGRMVMRYDSDAFHGDALALRIPVTMRPGLNELLLQTRTDYLFKVYLGDAPSARFYELAEQGLWRRLSKTMVEDRLISIDGIFELYPPLLNVLSLAGDQQLLHRLTDRLLEKATKSSNSSNQSIAAQILVLSDDPIVRQRADEVVTRLILTLPEARKTGALRDYRLRALTLYAALFGDIDEAQRYLGELERTDTWRKMVSPLRAIVLQQAQQREQAVAALEIGLEFWESFTFLWYQRVWYLAVLRKAELQITGETTRTDAIVENIEKQALATLQNRDPKTAAFDHLVETYGRISSEKDPEYPYLMRARRLAELGRDDAAAADFNKVVELRSPDGTITANLLIELGDQLFREGDWAAAAVVYHHYLQNSPDDSRYWLAYVKSLLFSGRIKDCHAYCADLLEQFGQTEDPQTAQILIYCLNRDPAAVEDWTVPLRLAELVLTSEAPNKKNLAFLYSRAGQHKRAIELREESIRDAQREFTATDCILIGLSYHGLGDFEAAKHYLDKANRIAAEDAAQKNDTDYQGLYRQLAELLASAVQRSEEANEPGKSKE
ncbi:protein kinase [Stieleria sp. ICT_E10.1]|nr:protein kinase [Stieleria sedimenti]